jgi:hypothetical protein
MKNIHKPRSLKLNRETLRTLSNRELHDAGGGGTGACTYSGCNTGCTDTTATYSKKVGHCPSTIAW